jgi:hypothetical protein
MEAKAKTAMVCLSEGMTLTIHIFQMKLFNAIASAAVIGTSFITAAPAEAGNGWIDAGTSRKGDTIYVRPLSRNGNLVTYEETFMGSKAKYIANCPAWQYKRLTGNKWIDVMPNSIGAAAHQTVCTSNLPSFTAQRTSTTASNASCNERVDAVFYRRYPELRGRKLTSMNGSLSREWMSIQDSIC